ncbi:MAG TPA: DoxX family protein [Pyrinomonadaceae bacterium]|nr:DoxX family protein [Pyrinomonadaceae bacterium]
MENPNRLKFLKSAASLGLLGGIIFSFELWFPFERTFPRVPFFFASPIAVDRLLTIVLVGSLTAAIFFQKLKIFLITAIASLILLILFDQMRLQPWVYQYLLLLVVIALTRHEPDSNQTLGLAQIVLAGLYFWSGVQKLNFAFLHETLPVLFAPLQELFPSLKPPLVLLGIAAALGESLIGIALLIRKTRNAAVCLAVLMHAIILTFLIAKNYNSIVWSWNAALIFLVITAFWRNENSLKKLFSAAGDRKVFSAKIIAAAFVFLPVLSFFGWWDLYLSGALYSGNTEVAVIRINAEIFEKLPLAARQNVIQKAGENFLPLFEWSIAELNVPAYPEQRISKRIAVGICNLAADKNQLELIIKERPAIFDGKYKVARIDCQQLEKP